MLSAAMVLGGGISGAAAQEPYYSDAPYAAAQPADSTAELRAAIDRLGREVDDLRGQLQDQRQTRGASAVAADTAADAAAADAPQSPLKKIEIVSKPSMTIEGRMYFDHIMFEDHPALVPPTPGGIDRLNETGFNTIRFGAKGTIYENVLYAAEVEFEGSETDFKDIYIELTNAPILGNVRVGHFKEPFSIEEQTSSRFITFMNRSLINGAFVPARNFGVMAYDIIADDDNWSWYAGAFRHDSPDNPTARASHLGDEGDWVFTGRVAGLLYYDEPSQGRYLVHVGGAYSKRNDLTVASFASRSELGTQAGYLTSTFTGDDDWNLFGAEAAIVWGPAHIAAEYVLAQPGNDEDTGGYVEVGYFLTGEHRGYKKDLKRFDRVKPIEDFFRVSTADGICMGKGAWQLKARYSWIDLNAGNAGNRGFQDGFSAGANWHWNPYTRMMFDYVHEDVDFLAGAVGSNDLFGMRFQIDY
jgi:phosphate-selective porin OprO/OprP